MAQEDIDRLIERIKEMSESLEDINTLNEKGYNQQQVTNRLRLEEIRALQRKSNIDRDLTRTARDLARAEIEAEKQAKTFAGRLEAAAGASVANQKALLVWGNRLNKTGETLAALGGGLGTFAKSLAEGGTKFTSLNPVIDGLTGAIGKMAEAIPFAGDAISGAMKLAAEAAKFMMGQLQTATDAFQEVSRVGGLAAQGMEGLMRQFQTSGMTLDGFKKAVIDNAADLAAFGGTVGRGAERFSRISQEIVDSGAGDYLRRLGFTADEMGASTARFIGQQQRLGFAQGKTFQELARSSTAYLKELDAISKITGQSREEQQKRLDEMLREGRFLATLQDLDEGRANQLKLLAQTLDGVDDELSAAIRDASSGLMTSDVVKRFNTAGIDIIGAVDAIKYSGKSYQEVLGDLQRQTRDTLPFQRQMAKVLENNNEILPNFAKQSRFATSELDQLAARADQEGVQTNKLTGAAADAQKSLEQMSRQMSALATTILPNFATVIAKTTDVLNQGLQKMGVPGVIGGAGAAPAAAPSRAPQRGPGAARGAGGMSPMGMSQSDLSAAGLVIKTGDVQAAGSAVSPRLISLAKQIQGQVPGFAYFSGFNDRFHQENAPSSAHTQGLAADFTVNPTPTREQGQAIVNQLKGMGFATVLDEYNNPSARSTAGHFHAAIQAATGGVFAGPKGGYTATLHGAEAVVPLPDGKTIPVQMPNLDRNMEQQVGMLGAQLGALEEIVRAMRESNSISTKLLQAANN